MEGALPENIQGETVNLNLEPKGVLKSEPKNISPDNAENCELSPKEEINEGVNGKVDINSAFFLDSELQNGSKSLQLKTYSPTIIESAFKVMKNLFSPDKTKSKTSNVISPAQQHRSASGSPTSTVCVPSRTEFLNSESGTENAFTFQVGENNIKSQLNMNEVGVFLSPITVESHNNTDESFLTTVSIIDDSFHSAITNFDENEESVKLKTNAVDNFLNGSQNLEVSNPCINTLGNSDYCLENTILKNGSFASEETEVGSISDLRMDGSGECWKGSQVNGICNGSFIDDFEKIAVFKTQQENHSNSTTQMDVELVKKDHLKEEEEIERCLILNDVDKTVKMENLFLNESFDTQSNVFTSSEAFPGQINCEGELEGEEKKLDSDCFNKLRMKESEIFCEPSVNEQNICLDDCISTTTVVLNSVDSIELEKIMTSLKGNASDVNTYSSQISFASSIDSASRENFLEKPYPSEVNYNLIDKCVPEANFPFHKPQKNKSSISENDSSNKAPNFNKIKLHKSDEVVNHRASSESPERMRILHKKKSSLDMSLIKNIEASEKSDTGDNSQSKLNFGTEELTVLTKEDFKKRNVDKNETSEESVTPPIISQQSYTILVAHDKNLNRPVIEPISDKFTFQEFNSEKCSAETSVLESLKSYCNSSLGAAESPSGAQQNQSTPLRKGNTPSKKCEAPTQFTSLSLNEDLAEFSPVNPVKENEKCFSIFAENETEWSNGVAITDLKSNRILCTEPNQDSAQKPDIKSESGSPQPHKLNQSVEKKQRSLNSSETTGNCDALNVMFEKTAAHSGEKTFTVNLAEKNQTFVVSGSPEGNEMNKSFGKTFVRKKNDKKTDPSGPQNLNETFEEKSPTPPFAKASQTTDARGGSPIPLMANQTFVKEIHSDGNQQQKMQETNKTFEVKELSECVKNVKVETQSNEQANAEGIAQSFDQVPNFTDASQKDMSESVINGKSSNTYLVCNELLTLLVNEGSLSRNQSLDDLAGRLSKLNLNESSGASATAFPNGVLGTCGVSLSGNNSLTGTPIEELNSFPGAASPSDDKLRCDPYLVQLIQEQFSSNDIEKICSVVDDFSSMKLSAQILKASDQFDKSFHENLIKSEPNPPETEREPNKVVKPLSPQGFDFLSSIQGKPTGRDWSRESLYVKFDPLVQPNPNSLIDFTKEGEALPAAEEESPAIAEGSSVCEQLLTISPEKKPDDIVPPLTPLSHKSMANKSQDKMERIKELQNEIYFLKNLYSERERTNKAKMEDYESRVTLLASQCCFLEGRLKESSEREKALVKKMNEQTQSLEQLKIIMEEYMKVISKLTSELEALRTENQKQLEALSMEKDSYMTHLQNTEAAFTDVHVKYEKSKKTIESLKSNQVTYRNTIAEQTQKIEELKTRAREAQEEAFKEFQKVQEVLNETKASHNQETARLRAQLKKAELKVEALQESLEQKIKENQQLTAICDELIEEKK